MLNSIFPYPCSVSNTFPAKTVTALLHFSDVFNPTTRKDTQLSIHNDQIHVTLSASTGMIQVICNKFVWTLRHSASNMLPLSQQGK